MVRHTTSAGASIRTSRSITRSAISIRSLAERAGGARRSGKGPGPTIAVVHALNLTIGFELSLGCDLMWAAEDASFGLVEATVGLTPGGGGTQRLVARAGVARAAELVMTGSIYPAAEMHQWGVVNRILPPAALLGAGPPPSHLRRPLTPGPPSSRFSSEVAHSPPVAHGSVFAKLPLVITPLIRFTDLP